jgi:single-strand DNA-binding protein
MASFNKVILAGNLTRDPQVKYLPSGSALATLGLAVNRTWFDKQTNQRKEELTFVDVTVFGKSAENAGQYLSKGSPVLVDGRLKLEEWDDKTTGQKRSKLGVVAESLQFLGTGKGRSSGSDDSGGESDIPAGDGDNPPF